MLGIFKNDPLLPLLNEYNRILKEANLLAVVNQKLAQQRFDRAKCIALQISAVRFRN